jgi:hypothetical protein
MCQIKSPYLSITRQLPRKPQNVQNVCVRANRRDRLSNGAINYHPWYRGSVRSKGSDVFKRIKSAQDIVFDVVLLFNSSH